MTSQNSNTKRRQSTFQGSSIQEISGPVRQSARLKSQRADMVTVSLLSEDETDRTNGNGAAMPTPILATISCSRSDDQVAQRAVKQEPMQDGASNESNHQQEIRNPSVGRSEEEEGSYDAETESEKLRAHFRHGGACPTGSFPINSHQEGLIVVKQEPTQEEALTEPKDQEEGMGDPPVGGSEENYGSKNSEAESEKRQAYFRHDGFSPTEPGTSIPEPMEQAPSCSRSIASTIVDDKPVVNSWGPRSNLFVLELSKPPENSSPQDALCSNKVPIIFGDMAGVGEMTPDLSLSGNKRLLRKSPSKWWGRRSWDSGSSDSDDPANALSSKPKNIRKTNQGNGKETGLSRGLSSGSLLKHTKIRESDSSLGLLPPPRKCGACRRPGHRNMLTSKFKLNLAQTLSKWHIAPKPSQNSTD